MLLHFHIQRLAPSSCQSLTGPILQLAQLKRFELCKIQLGSHFTPTLQPFVGDHFQEALSGNKICKLCHYYREKDKYRLVRRVLCKGGNYSNALYAIYQLCLDMQWDLHYFTSNIPREAAMQSIFSRVFLNKDRNIGIRVQLHDVMDYDRMVEQEKMREDSLVIERGVASIKAKEGVDLLGEALKRHAEENYAQESVNILLPSGTGTTCLFLAKYLDKHQVNAQVWTVPCVGKTDYLYTQMFELVPDMEWIREHIHSFDSKSKFRRFAQPRLEFYEFWKQFKELYGIELDLIYATKTLLSFCDLLHKNTDLYNENWIYIHTGGEAGNVSQLQRYKNILNQKSIT
jgi:1-aminocyclopropane-1-carboxylate deaminase